MDWVRFLEENNVHYITRGPNTKRGEISIQCPMCGEDDPSEHLGINLQTGKWGCHRDQAHRGKSALTLIKAILGCSSTQSQLIVKQYNQADPDTLDSVLKVLEADNNEAINHEEDLAKLAKHQALGPQFNDFYQIKPRGLTKRFFKYLMERGYDDPQGIIEDYDLRCAMTGKYKDRVIIPIRLNGVLLGWTSRALGSPKNAPRYLASSEDVKTTVFNYDELKQGGERLFIVEGPFDAIMMDSFKSTEHKTPRQFRATCTFGTSVTISQIALLRALAKRYSQTWVLFDQGADQPANSLAEWVGAKVAYLPHGTKDPGELKIGDLKQCADPAFAGYFEYFRYSGFSTKLANNLTQNNALLKRLSNKP